jgi:hypothetical protein
MSVKSLKQFPGFCSCIIPVHLMFCSNFLFYNSIVTTSGGGGFQTIVFFIKETKQCYKALGVVLISFLLYIKERKMFWGVLALY